MKILNVKTLNVQKTDIVEKGIGTLLLENQFKSAIKKYLGDVKFDLITYSTPPITFTNVVKYLKKKESASNLISTVEGYFSTECSIYEDAWREECFQLVFQKKRNSSL